MKQFALPTLLAILLGGCSSLAAQSRTDVLVVNLRNYGWEPPSRHEIDKPSIVLDHQGRLLVGFTVRERAGLVTRNTPSMGFHILRFTLDGKTDLSLSLPTDAGGRVGLYLSDSDQIIARANGKLQMLQTSEANPDKQVWKILASCGMRCQIEQSFSRHTLLLYTADADPPVTVIRLSEHPVAEPCAGSDSDDSSVANNQQTISDEFAYFAAGTGTQQRIYRRPLCNYTDRVELSVHPDGHWAVLNDEFLVVTAYDARKDQSGMEVVSIDGAVKLRVQPEKRESADIFWVPIRSSGQGSRIAIHLVRIRGENRSLGLSGYVATQRIAVYDNAAGKELASVPVIPRHRYRFDYDLSPDGRWLAILEDDTVKVMRVDRAR